MNAISALIPIRRFNEWWNLERERKRPFHGVWNQAKRSWRDGRREGDRASVGRGQPEYVQKTLGFCLGAETGASS